MNSYILYRIDNIKMLTLKCSGMQSFPSGSRYCGCDPDAMMMTANNQPVNAIIFKTYGTIGKNKVDFMQFTAL